MLLHVTSFDVRLHSTYHLLSSDGHVVTCLHMLVHCVV